VDEEVGLTGALHTEPELFTWTVLINLDTEDLGEITISSAWWARMDITLPIVRISASLPQYTVKLDGLVWGHSGAEIHHPRWNAHRIVQELLLEYTWELEVATIFWWSADNAIPAISNALVWVDNRKKFEEFCTSFLKSYRAELEHSDLKINLTKESTSQPVIAYPKEFLHRLATLPLGIQSLSKKIEGLTQTSLSRWILNTTDSEIQYSGALRSSIWSELEELIITCQNHIWELWTASVRGKYPWRQQDPSSELVTKTHAIYEEVLWSKVKILAVHAWLECGAIVWSFDKKIDAISFGPTIKDPHSPDERCEVRSIEITYEVLKRLLSELE
jgi:dipeptidase D